MDRRALLSALVAIVGACAGSASADEGGEKHKGASTSFTPLRTLTANVARADGRRGVFTVEAGVDAPDPGLHQRVLQSTPRLMNAYAATVQTFAAALRPEQVPDLDLLSQRLQADTDRVLGGRGARLLLGACIVN